MSVYLNSIEWPLVASLVAAVFVVIVETVTIIGGIHFCYWRKKAVNNNIRDNEHNFKTTINESYAEMDLSNSVNNSGDDSVANMNSEEDENEG